MSGALTRADSFREIHAAQEVLEAGIGAQVVETHVRSEIPEDVRRFFLISLFQKSEGAVVIVKASVDGAEKIRRDMSGLRFLLQTREDLFRFVSSASFRISMSQKGCCIEIAGYATYRERSLLKVCRQKGNQPGGWRRRIAFKSYRVSFGGF